MVDKVLVTGGSGAVGRAIVRRFVRDGHQVAFTWLGGKEQADLLEKETGAAALQADLVDPNQVQKMVEGALAKLGQIDVLVNNAGRTQVMPLPLIEAEDWDEILDANLKSMFLVTREVVRGMIARKQGIIINIGSLAGHRMLEVPVHYAAAKAGVTGFTLALARELARNKIRVNEVVPGLLTDGVGRLVPEKEMAEYLRYCAAGRAGEPEEVASVVAFLAGPDAKYINAQSIFVDGGI
jgi:NAD(P)-dependent dehydrogenase (short-subunit alcohol dehydrogenase family)